MGQNGKLERGFSILGSTYDGINAGERYYTKEATEWVYAELGQSVGTPHHFRPDDRMLAQKTFELPLDSTMFALASYTRGPTADPPPTHSVSIFDISKDLYGLLSFTKEELYINDPALDNPGALRAKMGRTYYGEARQREAARSVEPTRQGIALIICRILEGSDNHVFESDPRFYVPRVGIECTRRGTAREVQGRSSREHIRCSYAGLAQQRREREPW